MDNGQIVIELQRLFAEHERADADRFDQLQEGQRRLKDQITDIGTTVNELEREVGGAPKLTLAEAKDRKSLRDRVHTLETANYAAQIAQQALDKAQEANRNAWSSRQKVGVFAFAAVGAVGAVLRVIGVGG